FTGRAIMAVSQDQLALQLMAVNPIRIKRIAFGISIATAAIAGAFLIVIQPIEPSVGREYIGRVFAICVLGGLQSLPGTVIAAMLLGVVESITATFYGPSWAPAVAFGFLLLTLAFRPAGVLGRHPPALVVGILCDLPGGRRGIFPDHAGDRQRLPVLRRLHGGAVHCARDRLEHPRRLLRVRELRLGGILRGRRLFVGRAAQARRQRRPL